jgi:hypothetical protein
MTTEPVESAQGLVAKEAKQPIVSALPDEDPRTNEPRQAAVDAVSGLDDAKGEDADAPPAEAIPLTEGEEVKETFYQLRMGWSGKVYEMTVGGNDL